MLYDSKNTPSFYEKAVSPPLVYILKLLVRQLPLLLESAGGEENKIRLFLFPPLIQPPPFGKGFRREIK